MVSAAPHFQPARVDSAYAWVRAFASVVLLTVGFSAVYSIVVGLKPVATDLGATRGGTSIAYAAVNLGFGLGGILMGWWSDRVGIIWSCLVGSIAISGGLFLAGHATHLWEIVLAFGVLIGFFGISGVMVPLLANITHWFDRRRGVAVSIVASGTYLAGTIWPPILQFGIDEVGWRETWIRVGILCFFVMTPLAFVLRPRVRVPREAPHRRRGRRQALGFPPATMQCLLCAAGFGCCVAMATPQAHMVAHATDLGYPALHGANLVSVVFFTGMLSRVVYGWITDRIGGLRTLILGSIGQTVTIAMFIPVDGLVGLYVVCALFGLSQGGIVPAYTIIIRRYFAPGDVGWRLGWVFLFTMIGMAFGGWFAGVLFDLTGSYTAAFAAAIGFNLLNFLVAGLFVVRSRIPVFA